MIILSDTEPYYRHTIIPTTTIFSHKNMDARVQQTNADMQHLHRQFLELSIQVKKGYENPVGESIFDFDVQHEFIVVLRFGCRIIHEISCICIDQKLYLHLCL